MRMIRKVVVLGSGVMGSQIAAHLASVGVPVFLLDIAPPDLKPGEPRNKLAVDAIERLRKMKPSPVMHESACGLITPGNLEDNLDWVAEADWVLEAVVERLDVKQDLWRKVGLVARPGTILSTNTSGLSCAAQASALPAEHRRHFLGTHFFNPPRYMKLLELIPIADTDPGVLAVMADFGTKTLGKGVVVCNDTPNFIANRVGAYGLAVVLHEMAKAGLDIDEVDAITGPAMGRPRSATFRTLDLVGLDTFYHVAGNTAAATNDPEEKAAFELPRFIAEMVERGWLGDKTGQGFYKKTKGEGGRSEIVTLNTQTLEYGPRTEPLFAGVEAAKKIKDAGERIRALVNSSDQAGQFAWNVSSRMLLFCAEKAQEIANGDVQAIDRAMRWGFNWEIGPFEIWNALGVQETIRRMEAGGLCVPDWVRGIESFPVTREGEQPLSFSVLKAGAGGAKVVKRAPGVTLVDLGDEVLGMELHGPKQTVGDDYFEMALVAAEEVSRSWRGLVVSASAQNFCVGADLAMILERAQAQDWDALDRAVRAFQRANMLFKYLARPVVIAPHGMAVGAGAEIAMHSARVVAAAETYMGLVEAGVGLIPAGGGTKEMALRSAEMLPAMSTGLPNKPDLISYVERAFEVIATARASTSAAEARHLGYLRPTDRIVMSANYLLHEAKEVVLQLDREGYVAPQSAQVQVTGPSGRAVLELIAYTLKNSGYASDYDVYLAGKLAYVITGGNLPGGALVPEQYLLDLEREAFLHLCGQQKTQERMMYMLQNGKPLRN